jgi:WD40 repeat protein
MFWGSVPQRPVKPLRWKRILPPILGAALIVFIGINFATASRVHLLTKIPFSPDRLAFDPSGKLILMARGGEIEAWNVKDSSLMPINQIPREVIDNLESQGGIKTSRDGKFSASADLVYRKSFTVWTNAKVPYQQNITIENAEVLSTEFCGGGHLLAVGLQSYAGGDNAVRFWDCDLKKEVETLRVGPGAGIYAIVSTNDGEGLILGDDTGRIFVCASNPWRVIYQWNGFEMVRIMRLVLSPDEKLLAASCNDIGSDDNPGHAQVRVWSLGTLLRQ